jgi:hypothetical protein
VSPREQDPTVRNRSGKRLPFAGIAAAALLAAGSIWWASAPLAGGGAGTRLSLIVAVVAGVLSIAQLAAAAAAARDTDAYSPTEQAAQRVAELIRTLPWAELMTVATLALEALHASRPWHTALLAIALTGFLFAVHLAETEAGASVLRTQLPLLAAGAGLIALAVGATALPSLPAGPAVALVRVAAIVIAVVVAGLVVPAWLGRSR